MCNSSFFLHESWQKAQNELILKDPTTQWSNLSNLQTSSTISDFGLSAYSQNVPGDKAGTVHYMTVDVSEGKTATKLDDLISACFSIMEIFYGFVPGSGAKGDTQRNEAKLSFDHDVCYLN